jgi:rsbT co-antagonist protein RsbR
VEREVEVKERWIVPLDRRRDDVLKRWVGRVSEGLRGRVSRAEVGRELGEIYTALVDAVAAGGTDVHAEPFAELRALLTELSGTKARQGFSPRETAIMMFTLKDALSPAIDADRWRYGDFLALSTFVDELGLFTVEAYTRSRDAMIVEQKAQLLEVSTPVIKIWDGILAVPLVGSLDSARTQHVMEALLEALAATGSHHAIIDITGVAAVDTQVAQHLLRTVTAAQLMGAECLVSGLRPQIAQTVASLGIEFGQIVTKATLADALALALRRDGFQLHRANGAGGR